MTRASRTPRTIVRTAVAVGAAFMLLTACGTTDDNSTDSAASTTTAAAGPGETTTEEAPEETTTTEADEPADTSGDEGAVKDVVTSFEERMQAEGFTLTPTSDGSSPDSSDDGPTFSSAECQDFEKAFPSDSDELPGQIASEESGDLERGDITTDGVSETVGLSVGRVESSSDLDEVFGLFGDDRLPGCMKELFEAQGESDGSGGAANFSDVTVEPLDFDLGDESYGFEITAEVGSAGVTFSVTSDFVFTRVDRTAILVSVTSIGDGGSTLDPETTVQDVLDDLG